MSIRKYISLIESMNNADFLSTRHKLISQLVKLIDYSDGTWDSPISEDEKYLPGILKFAKRYVHNEDQNRPGFTNSTKRSIILKLIQQLS